MYKVLIVEDEEIIRAGLRYMVDWISVGCVVIGEAKDGEDGVKKILELRPDIVLLDINMPIKNGINLLREVHESYIFSTVVISGYDDFDYAKSAISYGVEEYLLKPVDHKELYTAVERAKVSVKQRKQYELIKKSISSPDRLEVLDWDTWNQYENKSRHIVEMLRYIETHYDKKINMEDIVEELEMSATYLNKNFKDSTGYTFNEFLNRYRIQKAIEIISKGTEKISTIAIDVGFSNYRYFIKVFKKYTKALPSDFVNYFKNDS